MLLFFFQLIENLRGDQTCETFLVSQHSGSDLCGVSLQPPPPPVVSSRSRAHMMTGQTSIDLGMLAQVEFTKCSELNQFTNTE